MHWSKRAAKALFIFLSPPPCRERRVRSTNRDPSLPFPSLQSSAAYAVLHHPMLPSLSRSVFPSFWTPIQVLCIFLEKHQAHSMQKPLQDPQLLSHLHITRPPSLPCPFFLCTSQELRCHCITQQLPALSTVSREE